MAWNDWGHWLTGGIGTQKGRDFLFGTGDEMKKLPTMTPEQTQLLNQFIQQLSGMSGGLNQSSGLLQQFMDPNSDVHQNFEAPYMKQFEQETIPKLAEQFGGFGANSGALSSSGFGQALGAAGGNLQTNLAHMKGQRQRDSINDFINMFSSMMSQGLGAQPFGYQKQQGNPGFLSQTLGQAIPSFFGG